MQLMKRVIAAALSLSVLLGLSFSASAHEMIPGCTVPPDGPNAISVGQATMDDSQGYDILAQFELRFEVEMDVDALPADVQSILDSTEDSLSVPLCAAVTVVQRRGTTQLTTDIVVRPENSQDTPLIRSVSVAHKYVNYTDFSVPDSYESYTIGTDSPGSYLEGVHDSHQAFASGDEIAISIAVSSLDMDNAVWPDGPVTASCRVTVQ